MVVEVALQIPRPPSSVLYQECVKTNRQARTHDDDGDDDDDDCDGDNDDAVMMVIILMSSEPSLRRSAGMHTDHISHQSNNKMCMLRFSFFKDEKYIRKSRDVGTL